MIYIAAPFFNEKELLKVAEIENCIRDRLRTVFSPRWLGTDLKDRRSRTSINQSNLYYLRQCDLVLAWIDRIMPDGQTIALLENSHILKHDLGTKPDDGVLFEIGYAAALNKPILVFTERDPSKINVMLLENVGGFVHGIDDLNAVISSDHLDENLPVHPKVCQFWKGEVI